MLKTRSGQPGVGFRNIAREHGITQAGLRRLDQRMHEDRGYDDDRWWEGMMDSGVISGEETPSEGSGVDFDLLSK